jgi:Tfp pilus assembly protein PilO
MMDISRRDKVLLIILAVLALMFLYSKLLLLPSIDEISNINSQINSSKSQLDTLAFKERQNAIIQKNIKKLQTKYDNATQEITVSRKDTTITSEINSLCNNHNVRLTDLTFQEGVVFSGKSTVPNTLNQNRAIPDGKLMEMGTSVSITGNISDIINFIDDLEHTNRIDVIDNVEITNSNNTKKATIETNYFYISGEDNDKALDSTSSGN